MVSMPISSKSGLTVGALSVVGLWCVCSLPPVLTELMISSQMYNIEEKREKRALLSSLPELEPDDDLELNAHSSFITRPSSPSEYMSDNKSPWRPLTNRDYAAEFKRRCQVLTKMRRAAQSGAIPPSSSRPSSPRLQAFTPKNGRTRLSEPDELTQNLWTCFLMLIENGSFLRSSVSLLAVLTRSIYRRQEPPPSHRVWPPSSLSPPVLLAFSPRRGVEAGLAEADGGTSVGTVDRMAWRRCVLAVFSLSTRLTSLFSQTTSPSRLSKNRSNASSS
jgi:hypothetical protein